MSSKNQLRTKETTSKLELMIQNLVEKAAQKIGIDKEGLQEYLTEKGLGDPQLAIGSLRLIQEHDIDPTLDHLDYIEENLDSRKSKKLFITLNGCIKIMNSHPCFQGIEFTNSEMKDKDAPDWIECTIYRSDRIKPIVVREYLSEANQESEIWQKMPSRMLRNRALTQCVKIAFGVNAIDLDHINPIAITNTSPPKYIPAKNHLVVQNHLLGANSLKIKLQNQG